MEDVGQLCISAREVEAQQEARKKNLEEKKRTGKHKKQRRLKCRHRVELLC